MLGAAALVLGLVVALPAAGAFPYHESGVSSCDDVDDAAFDKPGNRAFADARGDASVLSQVIDLEPFDPAVLVINDHTCVRWESPTTNSLAHTINIVADTNGDTMEFVGAVSPGDAVDHLFDEAGTYYVDCQVGFHEAGMHQVIHVE